MEVEKLQKLNDQRKYILDLENFKKRVSDIIIDGENGSSVEIVVKTNFNGKQDNNHSVIDLCSLRTPYDSCFMREEDKKSLIDFIDGMIAKENKKFQEM